MLPEFMDRADVGMIERRGGARLQMEPGQCFGALGRLIRKKFQRDMPPERQVFGFVDDARMR
jgi:hypothetical protein